MKLWKENKIDKEWFLSNRKIAEMFIKSDYYKDWTGGFSSLEQMLSYFICCKNGLNSMWAKGEPKGERDFTEIYNLIKNKNIPTE